MIRKLIAPLLVLLTLCACQKQSSGPIRKTFVLTTEQKAEREALLDALQKEPSSKWVESNLMPHRRLLDLPDVIVEMKDARRAYVFEVGAAGEAPPGTIGHLTIITDSGRSQPQPQSECPLDDEKILEVHYPLPATS